MALRNPSAEHIPVEPHQLEHPDQAGHVIGRLIDSRRGIIDPVRLGIVRAVAGPFRLVQLALQAAQRIVARRRAAAAGGIQPIEQIVLDDPPKIVVGLPT